MYIQQTDRRSNMTDKLVNVSAKLSSKQELTSFLLLFAAEVLFDKYLQQRIKLHGPSMFVVKAKIYGVLYNQASSIAFDETSSYWSALKSS